MAAALLAKPVGRLFGGGAKPSSPAPTPTRDSVEIAAGDMRRLRRRRGGGANELLGQGGAEAGTVAPKMLMGE
jgi:hypothetical protein